jgi:hypothetical protein
MISKSNMFRRMLRIVAAAAVIVALPILARPAMAAGTGGTLAHVQYVYFSSVPTLQLNFDNGSVIIAQATTASVGCSIQANTIDTIKEFQALALSGLLAGKTVNAAYTSCSGSNYLTGIDVVK